MLLLRSDVSLPVNHARKETPMEKERLTAYVSPDLKRTIEERADRNRRSLAGEVEVMLARAVAEPPRSGDGTGE